MLTDEELLTFIRENPETSLKTICDHFGLCWIVTEPRYSYSGDARALANQLQRLRRSGKITTGKKSQRWVVKV